MLYTLFFFFFPDPLLSAEWMDHTFLKQCTLMYLQYYVFLFLCSNSFSFSEFPSDAYSTYLSTSYSKFFKSIYQRIK
ncbi:hypothetical protein STCU_10015 [Strigomonas culicis]|uniref:Secreted protein n=1 Tax=Strigomonas culicis TaxID=28005 RepID=S9TJQ4_9TRYP|nr:hypothetical protein STCU_10015 [Strigomonas culicis]|eukprot:EPY18362.1 hypothetical protein STCU_10015 [Strigomonas culicis]